MKKSLEQFSYQSEVNTTTNPLWVSPYDVEASTVYESQELTIDMFQDDDSSNTTDTTRPNQLYESQELVVDLVTDGDHDMAPVVTKKAGKNPLYESQELKVDVQLDDDLEAAPSKPSKTPAKTSSNKNPSGEKKVEKKVEQKVEKRRDDIKPSASKQVSTKPGASQKTQELKVEMSHDDTHFDLDPLPSRTSAKTDSLYDSQELKIEMFQDNMEDNLVPPKEQSKGAINQKGKGVKEDSQSRRQADARTSSSKGKPTNRHSTPLRNTSDDDLLLQDALDGSGL